MAGFLEQNNILITAGKTTRLVTHLDIDRADIDYILDKIDQFFTK